MKKILFSLSLILTGATTHAQTVLLDEGFESYTNFAISGFGNWRTLDLDGLNTYTGGGPVIGGTTSPSWTANWTNRGAAMAFQIFNLSASNATNNATSTAADEEIRNFSPHAGQKCAVSWAGVPSTTGGATANNDWLITPAVTLGTSANILTFWVKALSPSFTESYKVGVYTGSGNPTAAANFTIVSSPTTLTAPFAAWQQVTINLDAYAGQTIRVGFQYMSSDQYMFMLDDVKITATGVLATNEVSSKAKTTNFYPNPTKGEINIKTDKKVKVISVMDMSGKTVAKTESEKADISALPKGTYIIKAEFNDNTSAVEKIVKQ
ncbi:T9SS type A sorting domain-containing protein [Chryseobacterium sp. L7]|uniref:T9SS type A sorting domain-containing protein n=1 Tax=Chryseobacterium endalhagicum TaxID=2797638 RepID=A0ABS1QGS1_9FLAO|nr:choice-of-anchor J domain-containing protein [Chryseobacterium endalhagicum]MBL1221811.1 T9SS type A sorting domain-containing protein [Chryseobacterium endalhagicum]